MQFKCIFKCISQLISVYFILLFNLVVASLKTSEDSLQVNHTQLGVFYSYESLLDVFHSKKYEDNPDVFTILCDVQSLPITREAMLRQCPIIDVSGIYMNSEKNVASELAKILEGKLVDGLPEQIRYMGPDFQKDHELNCIYLSLCIYITGYNVGQIIRERAVVISRYWPGHAASNLARQYPQGIPPRNSTLYQFPKDLIAPDLILFSTIQQGQILNTEEEEFNKRVTDVYRNFRNPEAVELELKTSFELNLLNIKQIIKERLSSKFPHCYRF